MGKLISLLRNRIAIIAFAILIQLAVFVLLILFLNKHVGSFYGVMLLLSALLVVSILNDQSNPSYKIAWIVPIMLFPVFGGIFYILFGRQRKSKRELLALETIKRRVAQSQLRRPDVVNALEAADRNAAAQSHYIRKHSYMPPFIAEDPTYYPLGEEFFEALKDDLRRARHYIFMEYFIVEPGKMWNEIEEILAERAKAGVKVRLMYDDVGCLMTLPPGFDDELRRQGIEVAVFNPLKPIMSLRYNTRDHRKITVIDGKVGYTGGCNLADEYINAFVKHGHWKDSALRVEGEAAWGFAILFLSLWDFLVGIEEEYDVYLPPEYREPQPIPESLCVVQPFTDDPLDGELVGSSIYINMINRAERYVYIKTPYLIIDNEMQMALSRAAKSGVDVRLITPGVPDKKTVFAMTRSYYPPLIESGVRIYEYTPGFVHEKVIVADERYAAIGTVNLDYRSLYLHYECGIWLYQAQCIEAMREDFDAMFPLCHEVTLEECVSVPAHQKFGRALLRFFAPLM